MSDRQTDKMSDALRASARVEARNRIHAVRQGIPIDKEADLPSLHKAQKITFEGRTVKLHLGSRGSAGKNIVALPELSQSEDAAVRLGRGVNVIDVNLAAEGKQDIRLDSGRNIKGARNLQIELCFSEQSENLRSVARGRE